MLIGVLRLQVRSKGREGQAEKKQNKKEINYLQNVICLPLFVTCDKFLPVLKYTNQDVLLTTTIPARAALRPVVLGHPEALS